MTFNKVEMPKNTMKLLNSITYNPMKNITSFKKIVEDYEEKFLKSMKDTLEIGKDILQMYQLLEEKGRFLLWQGDIFYNIARIEAIFAMDCGDIEGIININISETNINDPIEMMEYIFIPRILHRVYQLKYAKENDCDFREAYRLAKDKVNKLVEFLKLLDKEKENDN